jgi:hypothetical protein
VNRLSDLLSTPQVLPLPPTRVPCSP